MVGKKLSQQFFIEKCNILPKSENYDFTNTKYINMRTKVQFLCRIHGDININPKSILNGIGCAVCDKLRNGSFKNVLTLSQYRQVAATLHNNRYDYSLVKDDEEKIEIICSIHGIFKTRRSAHISPTQKYGCQKCKNKSKGEEYIIKYLEEMTIEYQHQIPYNWITYNKNQPLRFDFYLPKYNTYIEFDGKHHFEPVRYGGQDKIDSINQYEKTKFYDSIKLVNVLIMKSRLIRFDYTVSKNKIKYILNEKLLKDDWKMLLYGKIYKDKEIV